MAQAFRSTRVLTPAGLAPAALLVENGRIAAVQGWNEIPPDSNLRDFGDLMLLPGLVDSHVRRGQGNHRRRGQGVGAATSTTIEVPDLPPQPVDLGAYDALLAEVGT